MSTFAGAVRITRPLNCVSAGGAVLLGGYLSAGLGPARLWGAAVVATLLTAAANVVNDAFDIETDRVNKPWRALPSGQLSARAATYLAATLLIVALGLSFRMGLAMALVAVVMAVLLLLYSWKLKPTFLAGNLVIGGMSAMTVIYGGMVVGDVRPTLLPALMILLFVFCREVLKTVEDYDGDLIAGARTVAVVLGKLRALWLYAFLAALTAVASLLPWLLGDVSDVYVLLVVPGVTAVLLASAVILLRLPSRRNVRIALIATKADWVLWTIAMFIGVGLMR